MHDIYEKIIKSVLVISFQELINNVLTGKWHHSTKLEENGSKIKQMAPRRTMETLNSAVRVEIIPIVELT